MASCIAPQHCYYRISGRVDDKEGGSQGVRRDHILAVWAHRSLNGQCSDEPFYESSIFCCTTGMSGAIDMSQTRRIISIGEYVDLLRQSGRR